MRGSENLTRGLVGAGQSIGSAIEKYQEKKKQEQDELKRILTADKASMALVGALSEDEAATLGVPDKLSLSAMRAGEPTALVTGAFKALGVKQQVQSLRDTLEQRRARESAAQREAAFSRELAPLMEAGQAPENIPSPFSNEQFDRRTKPVDLRAVLAAASRTGNALNPNVDNLMTALSRAQEQGAGAKGFYDPSQLGKVIPLTRNGQEVHGWGVTPVGPNAGQLVNTGRQTEQATQFAQGLQKLNLQGTYALLGKLVDQRGRLPLGMTPDGPEAEEAVNLDTQIRMAHERIAELSKAGAAPDGGGKTERKVTRAGIDYGGATTPATTGLPLPKSKADLKPGQIYQTARGAAVWDGEKFIGQ